MFISFSLQIAQDPTNAAMDEATDTGAEISDETVPPKTKRSYFPSYYQCAAQINRFSVTYKF